MFINAFSLISDNHGNIVSEEELREIRDKHNLRRADRYTALVLAGALAMGFNTPCGTDTALITASAFGPHRTTFATLDDILDYPEDQIMPTKFSHSLHNAAASYVALALNVTGPSFSITGFDDIWFEALALAQTLLDSNLVSQVIVIGAEERALLTENVQRLFESRFPSPICEGVISLCLSNNSVQNRYGTLRLERDLCNDGEKYFYFGCNIESLKQIEKMSPDELIVISPMIRYKQCI